MEIKITPQKTISTLRYLIYGLMKLSQNFSNLFVRSGSTRKHNEQQEQLMLLSVLFTHQFRALQQATVSRSVRGKSLFKKQLSTEKPFDFRNSPSLSRENLFKSYKMFSVCFPGKSSQMKFINVDVDSFKLFSLRTL